MNLQQKTELASELIANAERQRKDAEATSAHYIGLANAALKPSTPTPRTDEARRIDNGDTHPLLDEMEVMERELSESRNAERLARVQLGAEREKVRVLRSAMKFIANDDNYMEPYFDPCELASEALAATEETK